MSLPKLNSVPKFEVTVPSTQEVVKFRPFLVKEEKVLMMAVESQDLGASVKAVVDTIDACIEGGVDKKTVKIPKVLEKYMGGLDKIELLDEK